VRAVAIVILVCLAGVGCDSAGSADFCSQAASLLDRDQAGNEQRFGEQLGELNSDDVESALRPAIQVSIDELRRDLSDFVDGTGAGWSTSSLVDYANRACGTDLASQTVAG
jgi:hypothetical protein